MTLSSLLLSHQVQIEHGFQQKEPSVPLIYSSIDLRNAGFKMARVDTNVFPAGFNNLSLETEKKCIEALKESLRTYSLLNRTILLIPESHTRNLFYFQNIATLVNLIEQSGYHVKVGFLLYISSLKTFFLSLGKVIELLLLFGKRTH